jgi:hypothetical protein
MGYDHMTQCCERCKGTLGNPCTLAVNRITTGDLIATAVREKYREPERAELAQRILEERTGSRWPA